MDDYTPSLVVGQVCPEVLRQQWRAAAAKWMGKRKRDTAGDDNMAKVYRKKTLQWLACLENVLSKITGAGLLQYQPQVPCSPASWPYLCIHADQGSDGFAGGFFLRYKLKLNCDFWPDPSHQWWRDIINSWTALGWGPWVRLMTVCFNLCHGPWEDGARYFQLQLSTSEYLQHQDPRSCPLFNALFQDLLQDFGMEDLQGCHDVEQTLWHRLSEHWTLKKKGAKVALCRFGAFIDACDSYLDAWTWMLIRIVYYGQQEHVFDADSLHAAYKDTQQAATATHAAAYASGESRTPLSKGTQENSKLRAACKNNIHVCSAAE